MLRHFPPVRLKHIKQHGRKNLESKVPTRMENYAVQARKIHAEAPDGKNTRRGAFQPTSLQGYNEWLKKAGVIVQEGISLQSRTLVADQDLFPGTQVAWVPRASATFCQSTIYDPLLQNLISKVPDPPGSNIKNVISWALVLLWHLARGSNSPMSPHMAMLPGLGTTSMPCNAPVFPREVLPELQDKRTASHVDQVANDCSSFFELEMRNLAGKPADPFPGLTITPYLFGWAMSMSMSRSFAGAGMPAFIDFANHASQPNCTALSFENEHGGAGVSLEVLRKVHAQESLTISYGDSTNDSLLLRYGFVLPDNPLERYAMPCDEGAVKALSQSPHLMPEDGLAILMVGPMVAAAAMTRNAAATSKAMPPTGTHLSPSLASPQAGTVPSSLPPTRVAGSSPASLSQQNSHTEPETKLSQLVYMREFASPTSPARSLLRQQHTRQLLESLYTSKGGESIQYLLDWDAPLTKERKACILQTLLNSLQEHLLSFPTSIQDDKQVLANLQYQHTSQEFTCSHRGIATSTPCPMEPSNLKEGHVSLAMVAQKLAGGCCQPTCAQALELAVQYRLGIKQAVARTMARVYQELGHVA